MPASSPADLAAPSPPVAVAADELEVLRSGVRLLALRSLGDLELAEEAAQETLARAVTALHSGQLRERAQLGAFVRGIARHVIADLHRSRSHHPTEQTAEAADPPSPEPDALHALVSAEEVRRVHQALARLSARDREIVRLSFFEGLTPGEVAERTGLPVGRIRKRKSRALERLRQAFHNRGSHTGHDSPPAPTTTR
ncbi:MAG: sigma-70 family RNA polymerase sigma factor [Gemmatimonadetes bacterium]|nr:sigma-70 family RNA polymerase sigma factor [Gemmatimonadota bacterium]